MSRKTVMPAPSAATARSARFALFESRRLLTSQARASMMRFIGVWAARRKCVNPASSNTFRSRASPAWAREPAPPPATASWACRSTPTPRTSWPPSGSRRCSRAAVQGERLDQQHRPGRCQVLPSVPGGAHRVAHVVQAVEEADQVEQPGVAGRGRHLKPGPPAHPRLDRPPAGRLDRQGVEVEPTERRVRVGGGHRHADAP